MKDPKVYLIIPVFKANPSILFNQVKIFSQFGNKKLSQLKFSSSKSTTETLEKGVKYVQS